jgi:peptide-methionine (S)-S-oxide reductase
MGKTTTTADRWRPWHGRPGRGLVALAAAAVLAATALAGAARAEERATAILAGGCFWCVEADFDKVDGVLETVSGYTGGHVENPGYRQVVGGGTGHYEAVEIVYDPSVVSYRELVDHFWRTVDPTDAGGQFCDRGDSYRTAVFVEDEEQRAAAEASKAAAEEALGREIVTPILEAGRFWRAEEYHQDYYVKNPTRYRFYRSSCGRDDRLEEVWGDAAVTAS